VKSWQVRDEQRRLKMSHSRRMGFSSHRIPNVRQPQCLLVHQACHICFAQKGYSCHKHSFVFGKRFE